MSLETGAYHLTSVSFATGQPVSRHLGPSEQGGVTRDVVVLPLGAPAPRVSDDILMFPNVH